MGSLGAELCFASLDAVQRGDPVNIFLRGDVGAGKTTFSRGYIKEWRGDDNVQVPSPSFLIDITYERGDGLEGGGDENLLHHMDLYRLKGGEDDVGRLLGRDIFTRKGIRLVEWPERLDESGDNMGCDVPEVGVGGGKIDIDIRIRNGGDEGVEGERGGIGEDGEVLIDLSNLDIDGDAERVVKITAADEKGLEPFLRDVRGMTFS